jgi:hypothetical protein
MASFMPADVEMAEAADQAHAVHLPGLFLETADQEHLPQRRDFLVLGEFGSGSLVCREIGRREQSLGIGICLLGLGDGHHCPRNAIVTKTLASFIP